MRNPIFHNINSLPSLQNRGFDINCLLRITIKYEEIKLLVKDKYKYFDRNLITNTALLSYFADEL